MDYYYGVVEFFNTRFAGRVYRYDVKGNQEIEAYRGQQVSSKNEAINDAVEWLDEHEIEAIPDGSW